MLTATPMSVSSMNTTSKGSMVYLPSTTPSKKYAPAKIARLPSNPQVNTHISTRSRDAMLPMTVSVRVILLTSYKYLAALSR